MPENPVVEIYIYILFFYSFEVAFEKHFLEQIKMLSCNSDC